MARVPYLGPEQVAAQYRRPLARPAYEWTHHVKLAMVEFGVIADDGGARHA